MKKTDFEYRIYGMFLLQLEGEILECLKNMRDTYSPFREFTLNKNGLFARDNRNKLSFILDYIRVLACTQGYHSGVF